MSSLEFRVTFHSAFRVGASYARDGLDAVTDRDDPCPGDHLKGLMAHAARQLIHIGVTHEDTVREVFGSPRYPCPWNWSGVTPDGSWTWQVRHRVEVSDMSKAALKDHVVFAEQVWANSGAFNIQQVAPVSDLKTAQALLRVSARMVHGLGSARRRGLGWVGIEPVAASSVADDLAILSQVGATR